MKTQPNGLMILGTDTDVGKTYVACRILEELVKRQLVVGAYKPVASGGRSIEESDGHRLWEASGFNGTLEQVNPQHFSTPLAPPIAAEMEGRQVDDDRIVSRANEWTSLCEFLVVEGAGGLMSPLSWTMTNASLAAALKLPIVLVSQNRLGAVNQVMTTLIAARWLGLKIGCVVLNSVTGGSDDASVRSNERMLKTSLMKFEEAPHLTQLNFDQNEFSPVVDWLSIAKEHA